MSLGELPPVGLYVVLATVMVWCTILTNELREIRIRRKRSKKQRKQMVRLRNTAMPVLNIALIGVLQIVAFLVAAICELINEASGDGGFRSLWELIHLMLHIIVILALYVLLARWLDKGQLNPRSRYV